MSIHPEQPECEATSQTSSMWGDERDDAYDENVISPFPPRPETPTPEPEVERPLDLDEYFRNREKAIRQLRERRDLLLQELRITEDRLRVVGIPVVHTKPTAEEHKKAAPRTRKSKKPKAARPVARTAHAPAPAPTAKRVDPRTLRGSARAEYILVHMSDEPERCADLAKRLGIKYGDVNNALRRLEQHGRVQHATVYTDGRPQALYSRA